jgi:hypothetical protein
MSRWYRNLFLAVLLPWPAAATTVTLHAPGYLAIDGIYYGFDLPRQHLLRVPAELHARGTDGFFFRAQASLANCAGSGDADGNVSPTRLRQAEVLDAPNALHMALQTAPGPNASVTLAHCNGSVVLMLRSASGATACAGSFGFPFRRGQCPAIDAADPGLVFFDRFERR